MCFLGYFLYVIFTVFTSHGWSYAFKEFKKPHIKYIFPTAPMRPVALNGNCEMTAWFNVS